MSNIYIIYIHIYIIIYQNSLSCRIEGVYPTQIRKPPVISHLLPGLEEKVTVLHRGDLHSELRNMATRLVISLGHFLNDIQMGKAWEKHGKRIQK